MSSVAASSLVVVHALHILWMCLVALLYQPFSANPPPLETRAKQPTNLALILSTTSEAPEDYETEVAVESVICAARCCRRTGIKSLSVYDRHGIISKYAERIKLALTREINRIPPDSECSSDASDLEYPLSDSSESRSMSPGNCLSRPPIVTMSLGVDIPKLRQSHIRRRQANKGLDSSYRNEIQESYQLYISLFSYDASKPFMASLARSFATSEKVKKMTGKGETNREMGISIDIIDYVIQDTLHLPPPDLMIVHPLEQGSLCCPPVELHGFPPWIMRLTEIYYDERPSLSRAWQSRGNKRTFVAFSEESFRRALDKYVRAEMRLGK